MRSPKITNPMLSVDGYHVIEVPHHMHSGYVYLLLNALTFLFKNVGVKFQHTYEDVPYDDIIGRSFVLEYTYSPSKFDTEVTESVTFTVVEAQTEFYDAPVIIISNDDFLTYSKWVVLHTVRPANVWKLGRKPNEHTERLLAIN